MDPNVTLRQMLEHMAEGEREGALDALDILRDWLLGGGLLPETAALEALSHARQMRVQRLSETICNELDELEAE